MCKKVIGFLKGVFAKKKKAVVEKKDDELIASPFMEAPKYMTDTYRKKGR